jgi:DNA helicase-2/ATP-dependent DNA helicase PcrA
MLLPMNKTKKLIQENFFEDEIVEDRPKGHEQRVFGPPGTGKTTHLKARIERASQRFGVDKVIVASYTKTAAHELISRDLPINKNNVGTLHSLCYRALGSPDIAEMNVEQWNEIYPLLKLSKQANAMDEPDIQVNDAAKDNDKIFAQINNLRNRMIPVSAWPLVEQDFYEKWCEWKNDTGFIDFTDMIDVKANRLEKAPVPEGGSPPQVGFFDEAQDFSKLQTTLIRSWSEHMQHVLFAGDDDQTLYEFTGASPDAFLNPPIDEKFKKILSQSYRVPRAIHAHADKLIKNVTVREPKEYFPRNADGLIEEIDARSDNPDSMLSIIDDTLKTERERLMILATCGFHLKNVIAMLRDRGLPFYNPFRRTRGDWNPLGSMTSKKSTSSMSRLLMWLRPNFEVFTRPYESVTAWDGKTLALMTEHLVVAGVFKRGMKKELLDYKRDDVWPPLEDTPNTYHSYLEFLNQFFLPEAVEKLISATVGSLDLEWVISHLASSNRQRYDFPFKILEENDSIDQIFPRIIVGTIHSVKGGEAENVILLPDVSRKMAMSWNEGQEGRNHIFRQFYVGMTRASERLYVGRPWNQYTLKLI